MAWVAKSPKVWGQWGPPWGGLFCNGKRHGMRWGGGEHLGVWAELDSYMGMWSKSQLY